MSTSYEEESVNSCPVFKSQEEMCEHEKELCPFQSCDCGFICTNPHVELCPFFDEILDRCLY